MSFKYIISIALAGSLGSLSISACDLDVPDLNNPGLDDLENHPTAAGISAACTGLLIGNRRNHAAENGLVTQLGILGREAYNFDSADPRYITEMLEGSLNKSSPFGGNFWAQPYSNIRLANIVLHGVDKTAEFSDAERSAIRGFTHTIQALDLLEVIVTHDTNGAVIDTDRDPLGPLAPIVDKATTYTEIARLLDMAVSELAAGGDAFPFALSSGFPHDDSNPQNSLDIPAGFIKINRAVRARVAVYVTDYAGALTALTTSFIDDTSATIDFDRGVYYAYSTKTGDTTNLLTNVNIFAHPSLETDAKNGTIIDQRFTHKVAKVDAGASGDGVLGSSIGFTTLYPAPDSRVALIRNEELLLLKAEALYFTGNVEGAITELDLVRTQSGGLPPLAGIARTPNPAMFVDELLYERRYSLLFEGGHRWIDLRRFSRPLPLDVPTHQQNVRYPIPLAECDARPGEPRCMLGST